jgi:rod shape-determining protein MreB
MRNHFTDDLAIDLGTDTTRIHSLRRGALVSEPTVVARDRVSREVVAVGGSALEMLGRTPEGIEAVRPVRGGVIVDDDGARALLTHWIGSSRTRFAPLRPRVLLAIPSGVTQIERRGLREAVQAAGAREVFLVPAPLAVMLGAAECVGSTAGHVVVDVGAGTTEVAIAGFSGSVYLRSIPLGGQTLDDALCEHIKREHGLLVGARTLERLKLELATCGGRKLSATGHDRGAGTARSLRLSADEVRDALADPIAAILRAIRTAIIEAPAEVCADAATERVLLSGGMALLAGFAEQLEKHICLPVLTLPDPTHATVRGCYACLERIEDFSAFGLEAQPGHARLA